MSDSSVRKLVLAEYYHTVWNQKHKEEIKRFVPADFVAEIIAMEDVHFYGSEGVEKLFDLFVSAVPDLYIEVIEMVEKDSVLAVQYIVTGTHVGIGHGAAPLRFMGSTWYVFEGSHLVKSTTALDHQMVLQIMGRQHSLD